MSQYPEHDKLAAVRDQSQAQGEFLEWLASKGFQLMEWREWDEEEQEPCRRHSEYSRDLLATLAANGKTCARCEMTGKVTTTRHYARHVSVGKPIEQLLADYHEIDLAKVSAEKDAMLASLRGNA